jgi:ribosomal protein S18 acetylase RimI-like enzyme/predicted nucleic acid-binding protein
MAEQYFIRRDFVDIFPFLDAIRTSADGERNALGFLSDAAYSEAAQQRKLILLLSQHRDEISYVGHLLFGGIFPILRVRQIAIAKQYRRKRHATTLLRTLIAQGENEGYLNIVANVATDLNNANSFYERNGFLSTRLKSGGKTRSRTINVRILQLETPSLLTYMIGAAPAKPIEIRQPAKRSVGVPIYAIDLNVFFDAIRQRTRSESAGIVFEAALNHQIRIAASEEFVSELRRTSNNPNSDPILSLAKRIPALPSSDKAEIDGLVPIISKAVFPEETAQGRLKSTDKSDVLHLAHAVAAGVAGYITSDAKVLNARDALMRQFKLDIIGLSEFVDLLDLPNAADYSPPKTTKNFRIQALSVEETAEFIKSEGIDLELLLTGVTVSDCQRSSVRDDDGLIGVSLLKTSYALDRPSRSFVCVRQEHPFSSTIADFLISEQVRYCSNKAANYLLMADTRTPCLMRTCLHQQIRYAA